MSESTFTTSTTAFAAIRHIVLDMDGTIYRGSEIFPYTLIFYAASLSAELGIVFGIAIKVLL